VKLGLNTASLGELALDAMLACNGNQLDPVSGPATTAWSATRSPWRRGWAWTA
jgi:hypothetical protein